mgnify:CR=1 FL=1
MARVFLLMDERAMDPEQFGDAMVYVVARTMAEARDAQVESGFGVIIRCREHRGVYEWQEYIP